MEVNCEKRAHVKTKIYSLIFLKLSPQKALFQKFTGKARVETEVSQRVGQKQDQSE